jgi:hypothetical protein
MQANSSITTLDEVTSLAPYKKPCFPLLRLFFRHHGLLGHNRFRTDAARSLKNFVPGTKSSAAARIKPLGLQEPKTVHSIFLPSIPFNFYFPLMLTVQLHA